MEVMNGLYRLRTPRVIEEKHGGGTLRDYVYWYLSFYKTSYFVGLYGSGPNDYRRFLSGQFNLKGEILEHHHNHLEFYIYNPDTESNIIFEGEIMNDKKELRLKAFTEEDPSNPWIDGIFDLIKIPDTE